MDNKRNNFELLRGNFLLQVHKASFKIYYKLVRSGLGGYTGQNAESLTFMFARYFDNGLEGYIDIIIENLKTYESRLADIIHEVAPGGVLDDEQTIEILKRYFNKES